MIKRLNYTGRLRIRRSDVRIDVAESSSERPILNATASLEEYGLPGDARVFIEAYRQTAWMRFPFGTVSEMTPPPQAERILRDFEDTEGLLFRLKVVGTTNNLLLAVANRIPLGKPEEEADREPLLPVVPVDLGDEIWQLDLTDEPKLRVNKFAAPDWRQMSKSELFISLVYPAAFRRVLEEVLITRKHRDADDMTDWQSRWLRFALMQPGVDHVLPPKDEDVTGVSQWIDDAVAGFARKLELKRLFANAWVAVGGEP